ncbi:hypothetical protein [Ilumatobacter sp.]
MTIVPQLADVTCADGSLPIGSHDVFTDVGVNTPPVTNTGWNIVPA